MTAWQTSTTPLPVPSPRPEVCRISYCDLWVRGTSAFCTGHDGRWKALGRPDSEDFSASYEESGPGGSEHIDLRRPPVQLRLEMQYALQCRHDEATKKIRPAWAQRLVNALADAHIRSLLDEPEEWKTFRGPTGNWATGWGTFLLGARRRIEELVYGRGWEAEYPRPVWRLRNLGIVHSHTSTITFEKISQSWLRDLAKRWARWRLSDGLGAGTVRAGVRMVARFSAFLQAEVTGLAQVDRALLERYLADLHAAMVGRSTHNAHISNFNTFLRTIRVHRWDEALPGNAAFVPEDYPTPPPLLPRSVAEYVMAQLKDPANLARWQDPARRLITLVLMRSAACASPPPSTCRSTSSSMTPKGRPTCATSITR